MHFQLSGVATTSFSNRNLNTSYQEQHRPRAPESPSQWQSPRSDAQPPGSRFSAYLASPAFHHHHVISKLRVAL
jgi:hypothetical protein